ncbi:MAG: AI-2E family transporter [bacterium]|nr:AI-2E family transporter [bacterium]
MNNSKTELNFLLILLICVSVLSFFIFKPFIYALILALIFSIVFVPMHERALSAVRGRKALAALLSTLIVTVIVIVPVTFLSVQIFQESTQLYTSIVNEGGVTDLSRSVNATIKDFSAVSGIPLSFYVDADQYVANALSWLLQHLGQLFAGIAKMMVGVFIFLIALYYLFKDGNRFRNAVVVLSPLKDIYDETIFTKLSMAVNSVIRGNLAIALVQGALTAIGFTLFGVPNPALWGSVAAIAALVPGIGTALVIIPAALYLFFGGETLFAAGLLLWGATAVGLVDNFLLPMLAGRGMRIHPFLILLSILGGISFFGPLGLLLGPLILSLLFVLLEIYADISKKNA